MEYLINGSKVIVNGNIIEKDGKTQELVIGVNYAHGTRFGGFLSSFNKSFTDEEIGIEGGFGDNINAKIGDIQDAFILFKKNLNNNINDINELACIIIETVNEYFGGFKNIDSRLDYYSPDDCEESIDNKISNLKYKGAAMCVERAALTQNLLCSLGIKSVYKSSGIIKNGNKECHSYNLIEFNNHYYIFDTSIPNIIDGKINPLIAEIDKESFDLISCPLQDMGISITVSHYNPYRNEDVNITYDSGRKRKIDVPQLEEEHIKNI